MTMVSVQVGELIIKVIARLTAISPTGKYPIVRCVSLPILSFWEIDISFCCRENLFWWREAALSLMANIANAWVFHEIERKRVG